MIELLLEAESALSLGLLDRAEILYRQVAGADPRNSIAVVGLARVLLERGDEAGALKQARRALAIDAENIAAQRMVQRLEEVLEHRQAEGLRAEAPSEVPAEAPGGPADAFGSATEAQATRLTEQPQPDPRRPPEPEGPSEPQPWSGTEQLIEPQPIPPETPLEAKPQRSRSVVDRLFRRRR